MPFDAHKNLAIATITTPPNPATAGTLITVATGEGARFPVAPFNATIWPAAQAPTPVTAEVVRVTDRTGDILDITRAQEGTTARAIVGGDLIAATITAKVLTDIESGSNFQKITIAVSNIKDAILLQTAGLADAYTAMQLKNAAGIGLLGMSRSSGGDLLNGGGGNALTIATLAPVGGIEFGTDTTIRGRISPAGGFSWGNTVDPGATNVGVAGDVLVGATTTSPGKIRVTFNGVQRNGITFNESTGNNGIGFAIFSGVGTELGSIMRSGGGVQYNTTSDARQKSDLGVARMESSGDVLRQTVIHDFTWTIDGTAGRGVFAQEAVSVAPHAVFVGSDAVDDEGHLLRPWGVDYGKYVPDLIVGWQHHDAQVAALLAANAALSARVTALETAAGPALFRALADWVRARVQAWRTPAPIPAQG